MFQPTSAYTFTGRSLLLKLTETSQKTPELKRKHEGGLTPAWRKSPERVILHRTSRRLWETNTDTRLGLAFSSFSAQKPAQINYRPKKQQDHTNSSRTAINPVSEASRSQSLPGALRTKVLECLASAVQILHACFGQKTHTHTHCVPMISLAARKPHPVSIRPIRTPPMPPSSSSGAVKVHREARCLSGLKRTFMSAPDGPAPHRTKAPLFPHHGCVYSVRVCVCVCLVHGNFIYLYTKNIHPMRVL